MYPVDRAARGSTAGTPTGPSPRRASSTSPTGTRTGATTGTTTATSSSSRGTSGIRMFGVNVPRAVVQTVAHEGLRRAHARAEGASCPAQDRHRQRGAPAALPGLLRLRGLAPRQHAATRCSRAMFRAQCTWDAAMGWNAACRPSRSTAATRRSWSSSSARATWPTASAPSARRSCGSTARPALVIPVPVADDEARRSVAKVQASYANFVWGLPRATDPLYPSLGISTPEQKSGERYTVIMVGQGLAGRGCGLPASATSSSRWTASPIADKETSQPAACRRSAGATPSSTR